MGSGPISITTLWGKPPLWCVCHDSQAQVCATWLHEPHTLTFVAASVALP